MAYSLGIDLGTTYSAAATARDDRRRDLPAGRASGDDPLDRGPARRRRGPHRRGRRTSLAGRADADGARVQAPPRRPDPDHPGRHALRRRGAARPPAARHRRAGHRAARRAARRDRACPSRELRRLQDRPAPQADPPGRRRRRHAADRARGRGGLLRAPGAGPGRRGHRGLRLRRRHVRCHDPAQDRGPGSSSSASPEGMERLGGIDFDEALFTRVDDHGPGVSGAVVDPDDPATLAAHRPAARGVPAGQGGAVVRHGRDDPGRPARPPDRDAADPRGVRGDDPAADHRDDRGARPGGQERGSRVRRASTGSCSSAAPRGSRSSRRWSARRPAGRSRSTPTRSTRWPSGRRFVAEPAGAPPGPRPQPWGAGAIAAAAGLAAAAGSRGHGAGRGPAAAGPGGGAVSAGGPTAAGAGAPSAGARARGGRRPASPWPVPPDDRQPASSPAAAVEPARAPADGGRGGTVRSAPAAADRTTGRSSRSPRVAVIARRCRGRRRLRDALRRGASQSPAASVAGRLEPHAVGRAASASLLAPSSPRPAPTPTPSPDGHAASRPRRPTPAGAPGPDHRHHAQRQQVRRPLAAFGYKQALPGRHVHFFFDTSSRRRRDPRQRPVVRLRRRRTRSRATRSPTSRPARTRCASSSRTPTTR